MVRRLTFSLMASTALLMVACGGDDDGAGGSGGTTTTSTGGGGTGGTGGGTGGDATGGMGGEGATGGMGGMGGGGGQNVCDQMCALAEMNMCGDPNCLTNCAAAQSSAMNTNCLPDFDTWTACMLALPDICDPVECQDELTTLVQCTNA
jgi:hypothetical protein